MTRAEARHQLALLLRDNAESPCAPILMFDGDRQALAIALEALREMDEVDAEAVRAEYCSVSLMACPSEHMPEGYRKKNDSDLK